MVPGISSMPVGRLSRNISYECDMHAYINRSHPPDETDCIRMTEPGNKFATLPGGSAFIAVSLVLATIYYAAARLGLSLAYEHSNATPIWPPSGIAFATALLLGKRAWPGILIGAFAANLAVFMDNKVAGLGTITLVSGAIAIGNMVEAILGAFLMRRLVANRDPLERQEGVLKFAIAALLVSAVGASIGTVSLMAGGIVTPDVVGTIALTWWVGDAVGILVVAPFILSCWQFRRRGMKLRTIAEALVSLALLVGVGLLVFGSELQREGSGRLLILIFVPSIAWAAYRFGTLGVSCTSLAIALTAVLGTISGTGPFSLGGLNDSLVALEGFIALCGLTGLLLAANFAGYGRAPALVKRSAELPAILTLIAALALAVIAWHVVSTDVELRARERFDVLTKNVKARLSDRIQADRRMLVAGAALFATTRFVDRNQWRSFVEHLAIARNMPGVQGVGYALRISATDLDSHVRNTRAEGLANYDVRPRGSRDEYTPIIFLEPFGGVNLRAFGYDMFSEPIRHAAMIKARDTGDATITARVTLVQDIDGDDPAGFLMYLPVYRNGAATDSVSARRLALQGYVYSSFRVRDLVQAIFAQDRLDIRLKIYDGSQITNALPIFDSDTRDNKNPGSYRSSFTNISTVELLGHSWTVEISSLPPFEKTLDRQKAPVVLVTAFVISLLLFLLVRSLARTRENALEQAQEMTSALRESETKFRSLAESANEAIVVADRNGVIVSWNRGAKTIFGYTEQEMIGEDLTRLMPERYKRDLRQGMARVKLMTQPSVFAQTVSLAGVTKSGREFPLELSLATWETASGRFYSGILRDTSEKERILKDLVESRDRLDLALTGSRLAIFEWNMASGDIYLSDEWARLIGAPLGPTFTNLQEMEQRIHPDDKAMRNKLISEVLSGASEFFHAEFRVRTNAGKWKWIARIAKVVERDSNGRALKLVGTNADIDYRKTIEENLQRERQLLTTVLDNIESGIVACDADGTITVFNRATRAMHNLPPIAVSPSRWSEYYDLFRADGRPMPNMDHPLFRALADGEVRDVEMMIGAKRGNAKRILLASGQAMYDESANRVGAVLVMHDITERKERERALANALLEKETLLREVYHRVKNNLQVLTSLFRLQVRALAPGPAKAALQDATDRVLAMALVHEKLYQSDALSQIDLADYIRDLCQRLATTFGVAEQGITLQCDVEPVETTLEIAVPLGLIVNELISNCLKHAFPGGRSGEVLIRLERLAEDKVSLTVSDNGVGLPVGLDPIVGKSLGLKLVTMLCRQLEAKLTITSLAGSKVAVFFDLRRPGQAKRHGRST